MVNNVAACEDWAASVSCTDHDFTAMVDCSRFDGFECDTTDYFDCLTARTTCDASTGEVDTSRWLECEPTLPCED